MSSRRTELKDIRCDAVTHAGLWLDRYLPDQDKGTSDSTGEKKAATKTRHVRQGAEIASTIGESREYDAFFVRWCAALTECQAVLREAVVDGRMVVGLGAESALETAVALHHTYGVPYIPGSALKGLAAAFAHQRIGGDWDKTGQLHREMFGTTEISGCITFFDALYIPGTGHSGAALWPDVMAVHHPDYYQGDKPPADWDSPDIIPFLSATGSYLIALGGDGAWVEAALTMLRHALHHLGIGAKTSSGYGRMRLQEAAYLPKSFESASRRPLASAASTYSASPRQTQLAMPPQQPQRQAPSASPRQPQPAPPAQPPHQAPRSGSLRGTVVARDDIESDWWIIDLADGRRAVCRPNTRLAAGRSVWVELTNDRRSDNAERCRFIALDE